MRYSYAKLYQKNYNFYADKPRLQAAIKLADKLLTTAFFAVYAVALLWTANAVTQKNMPYGAFMRLIGAPLFCLLIVSVLRLAIRRPRPYSEDGANITPLVIKKASADKSFPSRHLASAFVIAVSLLPYYPIVSVCLLPFAFALGYIRFALGLHYPSDLFVGAFLGALCGLLVLI
ncbi:MAG: phosphatase PAP2 family protein [Clostridia bacterium]|nr:phosphatase PAP2 family protein [Clostridia bacterium]